MNKLREAIADKIEELGYDKYGCVDQLFEIREDGCRLAVVKEKGDMPSIVDGKGKIKSALRYERELLEAHYIQEEL